MNTRLSLLLAAGAVFVAALFVAINATRSLRNTTDALAVAANERARLDESIRASAARVASAEKTQSDIQAAAAELRAAKPAAPAPAAPGKPASAPLAANPRELLAKDPMLQALYLESGRARLAQEYGPFFASLQLMPAQIEQFTAILMKGQEQMVDLAAAAQVQGADSKEAVATLQKRIKDEVTAAQVALLGAGGFRAMQDYGRSTQARLAVEGLVGSATLEGVPLTTDQAARLTAALAQASNRFASGGPAELATIDWKAADAQAQQILTPAQFALFKSSAPLASGATRWNLQLDSAVNRARQVDTASAPVPKPPTG